MQVWGPFLDGVVGYHLYIFIICSPSAATDQDNHHIGLLVSHKGAQDIILKQLSGTLCP